MIIKKTSMPSPFPTSNIVGEKKVSDTDVYNCNYVNNINKLSYSEVKTGEIWVDGKPLYRKVISIPKSSLTSGGTVEIANNITNLEMYISITGFIRRTETGILGINFPHIDPTESWNCYSPYLTATRIAITTGSAIYGNINSIVVIILYTKTTD